MDGKQSGSMLSMSTMVGPFRAALLIPTGIGAEFGGYGGDAMPVLKLLASVCDGLVTHPNVANGAAFHHLPPNALYVEGAALDGWLQGKWALRPVRHNRIGILVDAGIPANMLTLHHNAIAGTAAVYGLTIDEWHTTTEPLEFRFYQGPSGLTSGSIANPEVLLEGAKILAASGVDAIALLTAMSSDLMPEDPGHRTQRDLAYAQGQGVDPIGGLEGILSHLVVEHCGIPCAHAPVFPWAEAEPERHEMVDPRAATEYITPTYVPCILQGLHRSPQLVPLDESRPHDWAVDELHAVVVPGDALGGVPVLAALQRNIPVIAVMENTTVMDVGPAFWQAHYGDGVSSPIIPVATYLEAAGVLVALREGISLGQLRQEQRTTVLSRRGALQSDPSVALSASL